MANRSAEQWLRLVTSMRRATSASGFTPHKPLLLLLAVERLDADRDAARLLPYAEWERPLAALLEECNALVEVQSPQEPYWRLQRDGLWQVVADVPLPESADPPPVTVLRGTGGGLPEALHVALAHDGAFRRAFRDTVLAMLTLIQEAAAEAMLFDVTDESVPPELEDGEYTGEEGRRYGWHRRVERNRTLVARAKDFHGDCCQVCGLRMGERYGERGDGYIEAHHRTPVSVLREAPSPVVLDARTDFVVVCPNCHRMLHRRPAVSPEDLAAELQRRLSSAD